MCVCLILLPGIVYLVFFRKAVCFMLGDAFFIFLLQSVIQVKDLPAHVAAASNNSGSSPKDLFEDVAEELQKQVIILYV